MESNGFNIRIKIDMPGEMVKELNSFEELREYAPKINRKGMEAIGAVPVKNKKR